MPLQSRWFIQSSPTLSRRVRLFAFHYAGGNASVFRNWPRRLHHDVDLLAVQLPGRCNRFAEPLLYTCDEIVHCLIKEITPYLDRPFLFFGHSIGGLLAYELVAELQEQQHPLPRALIVAARRAPMLPSRIPVIHDLPRDAFVNALRSFEGSPEEILSNDELMNILLPIARADFHVSESYTYQPRGRLRCPIVAIGGRSDRWINQECIEGWRDLTEHSFQCRMLEGGHFFLHSAEPALVDEVNRVVGIADTHERHDEKLR